MNLSNLFIVLFIRKNNIFYLIDDLPKAVVQIAVFLEIPLALLTVGYFVAEKKREPTIIVNKRK